MFTFKWKFWLIYSDIIGSESVLWLMMAWCFSTRPSPATMQLNIVLYLHVFPVVKGLSDIRYHHDGINLCVIYDFFFLSVSLHTTCRVPVSDTKLWCFLYNELKHKFQCPTMTKQLIPHNTGIILGMVSANERRRYKCNVVSHCLSPYPKWSLPKNALMVLKIHTRHLILVKSNQKHNKNDLRGRGFLGVTTTSFSGFFRR